MKITDVDLIRQIKSGNNFAKYQLWQRYQPLVFKKVSALKVITRMDFDDLYQELYIAFERALDYFDISKITDESFKFGTIFFFYIKKVSWKIRSNYFKHKKLFDDISYDEIFEDKSDPEGKASDTGYRFCIPDEYIFRYDALKEMVNSDKSTLKFFKNLNEKQLFIVDCLLQSKNISEIARDNNIPYSKIYKEVNIIKEKAKKFLSVGAYE